MIRNKFGTGIKIVGYLPQQRIVETVRVSDSKPWGRYPLDELAADGGKQEIDAAIDRVRDLGESQDGPAAAH